MIYKKEMNTLELERCIESARRDPAGFIAEEERLYGEKIKEVADGVAADGIKLILLCGPSASGKTTSSDRLTAELEAEGHKVNRISLDDFYKSASELPLWSDGEINYESIEGLDIPLFKRLVTELFEKGQADFPVYNFKNGGRSSKTLLHNGDTYMIVEGIHALNPEVYDGLGGLPCRRVYVSVHSDFVSEGGIGIHARDLRLARRLLRDKRHRSAPPEMTFGMWQYILRGEALYIRPFRTSADYHIDTTHAYEPFVYARLLKEALNGGPLDEEQSRLSAKLLKMTEGLPSIPVSAVPGSSLLQEFVG